MSLTLAASAGRAIPGRTAVPLLLLDADGTVRRGGPGEPHVNSEADVEVYPDAAVRVAEWRERGGRVAIVSNQGGVGAGIVTNEAVASAMRETVRQLSRHAGSDDSVVDVAIWCAHDPGWAPEVDDGSARPREHCWCRKPAPGLLIAAAMLCSQDHSGEYYPLERALMVGDQDADHGAARNAGVAFSWAHTWREGGL